MGSPLSANLPTVYTTSNGARLPLTPRRGRGVLPSYASASLSVISSENVTVTIPVGALTSATGTTVSGKQNLASITAVQLATSDTGQIVFANVSVTAPANGLVGFPTLALTSNAGKPAFGTMSAGQRYGQIGVSASVLVWAIGAMSAGSVIVTATVLLLGTALGD